MKKTVALGVAGAAALVVAAWRRVQHDNSMPDDIAVAPGVPVDQSPAGADAVDESSSKAELYEVAQELEIDGRSKMNKTELLAAIRRVS